jgi:hypothetical protein
MSWEQKAIRAEWDDFPAVIVHSSIFHLKRQPEYYAAKFGNHTAAARLVKPLVRPERIAHQVDFVVPVIQIDRRHYNAIPVALGAYLARELGAKLWLEAYQRNKVDHTEASAVERMLNQPIFEGVAPAGRCLICDDVVTYGASLANLRGFLVNSGATVVAASVIGAAYGSTKLDPGNTLIANLRNRYGPELERFTNTLGFGCECLTAREAYFLAGLRTAQRLRNCFAEETRERNCTGCFRV